ncbi:MAG: amidohydrolase family protein [Phycisphaerales bacterium]
MSPDASNKTRLLRIDAAGVADARGHLGGAGAGAAGAGVARGVSVLVRVAGWGAAGGNGLPESAASPWTARLLAVGPAAWVAALPECVGAEVVACPNAVLIPGLVNAHAHLDLTHIGPRALARPAGGTGGFRTWIDMIRAERRSDDEGIAASVRAGVALLRRGGTVAVGDIAGAVRGRASLAAFLALRATGMAGVSFIEFFALGAGADAAIEAARAAVDEGIALPCSPSQREGVGGGRGFGSDGHGARLRIGLSPHATYSAGTAAYRFAADLAAHGIPACSHVAESPEERELVLHQRGPLRELLEAVGVWNDAAAAEFAAGGGARSPVHQVGRTSCPPSSSLPVGAAGGGRFPLTLIHVNDCSDADLVDLVSARASVVYCPRASAYFGAEHHFGPHRYREMLAAGMNVALGTDSIVNLPPGSDDPHTGRIGVLDEMRFLHQRDGTDARTLLAMGTTNAARVLGLSPEPFTLLSEPANTHWRGDRPLAGLLAVDSPSSPHAWLASNAPPRVLV